MSTLFEDSIAPFGLSYLPLTMTKVPVEVSAPLSITVSRIGQVLAVAPATARQLGYETQHLLGTLIFSLIHPGDRPILRRLLQTLHTDPTRLSTAFVQDATIWPVTLSLQTMAGMGTEDVILIQAILEDPDVYPAQSPQATVSGPNPPEPYPWCMVQIATDFAQKIRHSLDLDEILTAAVTQVQTILHVDRVLIYRIDRESRGQVLTEACRSPDFSILSLGAVTYPLAPECLALYRQGTFQAISSVQGDDSVCAQCLFGVDAEARLVVPILQRREQQSGNLWGLLVAQQCQSSRIWQSWEVELMSQLRGQLELAVYQSELYHEVQRLNTELEDQIQLRMAQLQQAYDFEATLKRITDRVRDSLDEDQILQAAVRELATVIRVSGCTAAIYDLQVGSSTVRYEYTTTDLPYHGRVIQLDAFPEAYTSLLAGRPIQFCSLLPNPIRGTVSTLAVPILDDKGVLGDLWLVNHKEYAFSEQDIGLVQQVANQCAIAIRQARLYQASTAQVRELERLNQLKDDFLSTVSHELRTPMANVKMAIQMLEILLQQEGFVLNEDSRLSRYLRILHEESQREISLITDLLDLSRLDSGADSIHISSLDLTLWLPQRLQVFEEQVITHQQNLVVSCPETLPVITTDSGKLERILTELLTNAFKYTPTQETITVQVREVYEDGRAIALRLSVTNTGVEIPQEEQERIFEKFYRIPNNDPWQYGGTGLGLALVKQMVHQLAGRLTVESGDRQTCFTVELPLYLRLNGREGDRTSWPAWPGAPRQSPLVLPDR